MVSAEDKKWLTCVIARGGLVMSVEDKKGSECGNGTVVPEWCVGAVGGTVGT